MRHRTSGVDIINMGNICRYCLRVSFVDKLQVCLTCIPHVIC